MCTLPPDRYRAEIEYLLSSLDTHLEFDRAPSGSSLLVSMSSTTLSNSSASRFQSILNNALQDYTKQTGVDLAKYDSANGLELCGSLDEVLLLLRDRAKTSKEYREGNRGLINWIAPVVQVVQVLARVVEDGTSIVSRKASKPLRMTVLMFNPAGSNSESRKSNYCWCRCSPRRICVSFSLLPYSSDAYIRQPLVLVPAMVLSSTFSSVSEALSDVSVFTQTCHLLMEWWIYL